jgi:hypothetical protein
MNTSYLKVLKTIESADYHHLKNGSVLNLINNFGNMYSSGGLEYSKLYSLYVKRINMYENVN